MTEREKELFDIARGPRFYELSDIKRAFDETQKWIIKHDPYYATEWIDFLKELDPVQAEAVEAIRARNTEMERRESARAVQRFTMRAKVRESEATAQFNIGDRIELRFDGEPLMARVENKTLLFESGQSWIEMECGWYELRNNRLPFEQFPYLP